jgi:purine-binding chemotaxis protein CheW
MVNEQQSSEPHILFQLGKTHYGVPSRLVEQMEMVEEFTPVPNAPEFVEGLVFVRGRVIPAINLRRRFGFSKIPYDTASRLMVVRSSGRSVGLIVDTAREFLSIDTTSIQPPPDAVSGLSGQYLKGIASLDDRLVLILDIEEILNAAAEAILPKEGVPDGENAENNITETVLSE